MPDTENFVEVRGASKHYGNKVAVEPLDLSVRAGEFVSLLGPSGSGKTTVLRMLAGLVRPDSGTIRIADTVVFDDRKNISPDRRGVGLVFQDFALWPHMSVRDNISFGLRIRGDKRRAIQERVGEMVTLTNLVGMEHRYPHQLSGGQQQRVALARALATAPKLLLLDEPLSSLDAGLRESMRDEIKRIVRTTGTTVVNVTHDQEEAMVISDRILLLRDGRLQQEGSPGDLYWRPKTAFVARFMGPTNIIQGSLGEASDGLGTLVNDGLTLRGRVGQVAAVRGASVTLLCRTEDAAVRTDRPSGDGNTIAGSVANAWFAGGRWRVRVSADAGFDVVAIADTDLGYAGKVWVSLPPERCWLLDPEETGGRTGPT